MNCIVYLVRSSEEDVENFNKSLSLVEDNVVPATKDFDIIVFCEPSFEDLKSKVKTNLNLNYQSIEFSIPDYPQEILDQIPEFFPHPTHGNGPVAWGHPGFSIGYRHMCRFFSGHMYEYDILHKYDYYLRLDTDSYITTKIPYDIFELAKQNEIYYGFIKIEDDNPKVVEGLWETVDQYIPNDLPENLMFYTNFELGKVSWFLTSEYMKFYNYLDKTGGFYTKRWGDAPVKFLGINLLMEEKHIGQIGGFIYNHG
jgi:alpha 1,2-mannosyltransferase